MVVLWDWTENLEYIEYSCYLEFSTSCHCLGSWPVVGCSSAGNCIARMVWWYSSQQCHVRLWGLQVLYKGIVPSGVVRTLRFHWLIRDKFHNHQSSEGVQWAAGQSESKIYYQQIRRRKRLVTTQNNTMYMWEEYMLRTLLRINDPASCSCPYTYIYMYTRCPLGHEIPAWLSALLPSSIWLSIHITSDSLCVTSMILIT
jgi:hypothetical protein